MDDTFILKVGDKDLSALITPLAVGSSSDEYPKSIIPIPYDAPEGAGDPYRSLIDSITAKSTDTGPGIMFCRFALQTLNVKVELERADYGLKEGVNKLWGKPLFEVWPEQNGASTATAEQIKTLLGIIALASRCKARPGPDRSDYLKLLWQRGISLVDQQLVTQLGIEEYQPEIIKSLVSNFSAATLALLYISTRGKSPMLYPESFQFGVLAVQGISNSLLSHWLRVGQLFDIGPSIIAASVPFREIRQLCTKILEKSADLGQAGPQITLFLQALGRNFTGFSIRASPFTSALLTLILLFATDSRTLLYLYAGAGVDVVIEMAKRAYLWTTGLRAVQGQFAQVTIGEEVVDPIVHDVLHQGNLDPPLTQRITSFERKDLVRYLLWLMTHYVVLLRDGVRLPDGRVVSEETYLLSVKELLQPDPNSRPFPESSLGKILSRRYRPHDAPAAGVPHRDAGAPPLGRVAGNGPAPAQMQVQQLPAAGVQPNPNPDGDQADLLDL